MKKFLLAPLLAASLFASQASAAPHTELIYGSGFWGDQTTATVVAINQAIAICQQSGGSVLFGYQVTNVGFFHPNWYVTVSIRCQYL
ncbi:hypothetical protein [Lysobacter sp. CA199]|uniref:hypothetical protein n=1 Tax=Lysobacter sp. CA199 TaxID=3455608 RepID=UPI003F8CFB06